jgi:hypothetical protein
MPIKVQILEKGHVFRYYYTDPWGLTDLIELDSALIKPHLDAVQHKVHSVVNMTASHHMPAGVLHIRHSLAGMRHPNSGLAAIVGGSNLVRVLNDLVTRIARVDRGKFFSTEDEAWAYIREVIRSESHAGD